MLQQLCLRKTPWIPRKQLILWTHPRILTSSEPANPLVSLSGCFPSWTPSSSPKTPCLYQRLTRQLRMYLSPSCFHSFFKRSSSSWISLLKHNQCSSRDDPPCWVIFQIFFTYPATFSIHLPTICPSMRMRVSTWQYGFLVVFQPVLGLPKECDILSSIKEDKVGVSRYFSGTHPSPRILKFQVPNV